MSRWNDEAFSPDSPSPRRIALTGGSGFVGFSATERLRAAGHFIRSLRHQAALADEAGLETCAGNLRDPASLERLVQGCDTVIHIAGLTAARSAREFQEVNADGAGRLAEIAARAGVKRFLFVSSLAARHPELSPYAKSKHLGEQALIATGSLAWDIFRPPAVYGPGDRALLPLLRPLKYRLALLPAGAEARASVLHVDDLAAAIAAWAALPDARRAIYELDDGMPSGYPWRELLAAAARALDVAPFYVTPPPSLLKNLGLISEMTSRLTGKPPFLSRGKLREMRHADWIAGDSRAFERRSGYAPRILFAEGIAQTIAAYRRKGWL